MFAVVLAMTSVEVVSPASADVTGLAGMHTLRHEGGRLCMADHWHYGSSGTHRSRRAAINEAIRSWSEFVDLEYGSSWARWSRAASRKASCSRAIGGFNCNVEARPCK
jgi:hypothetical protein